jgi:hypothetical protein
MSCPINDGVSRDSGCIPNWSISTWVYKDYPGAATDALTGQFNQDTWLNSVADAINNYNNAISKSKPTSQISQLYPYVSDLELPWVSASYANNGTTPEPLFSSPPQDEYGSSIPTDPSFAYQISHCTTNSDCFNQGAAPSTYWSLSDPTKVCNQYGFFFVETTTKNSGNGKSPPTPPSPQLGNTTTVPETLTIKDENKNPLNISEKAVIIDGRIDNGYLQGFNEFITTADAINLADLIVNGGYSQTLCKYVNSSGKCKPTDSGCTLSPAKISNGAWAEQVDETQLVYQVGVGAFCPNSNYKYNPVINGIQLDLEPFDSTQANQIAFYNKIATNLKANSQYWSIFTFPKAMTQVTADLLNGTNISGLNTSPSSGNNGYMIVALYDLVDMKNGIPAVCETNYTYASGICDTSAAPPPVSATGDATTAIYDLNVPHSAQGYYNAALLTVKQTITLAKQYGIKYKFAIPASSSVHEFENWGQYMCQFTDFTEVKPINGFCRMYNGLPLNPNSGNPSQIDYMQQALRAIYDGIASFKECTTSGTPGIPTGSVGCYDSTYFKGIDLYGFSIRTIWSPQNPVVDYDTGNVFYGNTSSFVPATADGYTKGSLVNPAYIYTTPAYPDYKANSDGTPDSNSILGWLSTVTLDVRPCGTTGGTYCPVEGQTCTNGTCS